MLLMQQCSTASYARICVEALDAVAVAGFSDYKEQTVIVIVSLRVTDREPTSDRS